MAIRFPGIVSVFFLNKYDLEDGGFFFFFSFSSMSVRLTFGDMFARYVAFNGISFFYFMNYVGSYFNNSQYKSCCTCYERKFTKHLVNYCFMEMINYRK